MFRRLIIISGFLLFLLIATAAWNIRQAGKPMSADEIPHWELVQETQDSILLQSVAEPEWKTEAFLAGPSDRFGCDTLIMIAGAETGPDFFQCCFECPSLSPSVPLCLCVYLPQPSPPEYPKHKIRSFLIAPNSRDKI